MLLDQIDALDAKIGRLTTRIDQLLAAMEPEAVNGGDATGGSNPRFAQRRRVDHDRPAR